MKLLVLAQTPPPVHGQSVMVQALLDGLHDSPGLEIRHVNLRLSRDNADIGRWSVTKILRTFALAFRAVLERFRHGCDTLYYVPAPPGKRGALFRDWIVLALCRPFFRRTVFHWHAAGLADWLQTSATPPERALSRCAFRRPALSIVLSPSLRRDAEFFQSRRVAIVPNGVPDPGVFTPALRSDGMFQAVFLGLCSEEKGVFAAAAAIIAANRREPGQPRFRLVAAGPFPDQASAARFSQLAEKHPGVIEHAGSVGGAEKSRLLRTSHCLVLPTTYPAEGLPLVVLEALAHDLPVIATRWRALPDAVDPSCGMLVAPGDTTALVAAVAMLRAQPPAPGACRKVFLERFELSRHLRALREALATLDEAD